MTRPYQVSRPAPLTPAERMERKRKVQAQRLAEKEARQEVKQTLKLAGLRYDYGQVDEQHRERVQMAALEIRSRLKRTVEDIVVIGKMLDEVKAMLALNLFGAWLHEEFDLSHRMAQNFMNVAMVYGNNHGEIISLFTPTTLYLLSAPNVPDIARQEARSFALSEQRRPSVQEIKQIVARNTERLQPVATTILFTANAQPGAKLAKYRHRPYPCSIQFDGILPRKGQMVIYGLTDPRTDEIYYVGATSNFNKRMKDHVRDAPAGHWAPHLSQEEIDKLEFHQYTWHARKKREIYNAGFHTIVQILDYAKSYEAAQELETAYIRKYVPGQADSSGIREPNYPFVPPPPSPEPEPETISAEYTVVAPEPKVEPLSFAEWLALMPADLGLREQLAILTLAKATALRALGDHPKLYNAVYGALPTWSQMITTIEKELKKE
jgi:hypothetical protein